MSDFKVRLALLEDKVKRHGKALMFLTLIVINVILFVLIEGDY